MRGGKEGEDGCYACCDILHKRHGASIKQSPQEKKRNCAIGDGCQLLEVGL
jgi:hypothetical protein